MVIQLGLGIQATQAIFDPPRVVLDSRDRQNLSFKAARLKFTTTQQPSVSRRFGLGIQALQRSILDSMEPPRVVLDSKQHQNLSFEATPASLKFSPRDSNAAICFGDFGTPRIAFRSRQTPPYFKKSCRENRNSALSEPCDLYRCVSNLCTLAIFFGSAGKIGIPPCPNHAILCRVSATYSGLSGSAGDLLVC
ncbi:uncharacterized protein LOC108253547 [Diaphorina citri]|uniref:Uncharacterized protein LOC108253547 n=1 Tax=Diaphorina citri TaxID=121845 RepID=A0A1S4ELZ0_DIACI|nr:uncharacterized protein LOC108253547 [Diaphorina citri]